MFFKVLLLSVVFIFKTKGQSLSESDLSCTGRPHYNATLTAYYPDFSSDVESDYLDSKGKKLKNLQDFLDGRADYVTIAMDEIPKLTYGSVVCIPELNEHFGRRIPLQVRDHGINLKGKGYSRLDICVRTEADSYDNAVNRLVTIYTQN